jgi:hypothetical protein
MNAVSCTSHCSACGSHFSSIEAFDAHRVGSFSADDPESARQCEHPLDANERTGGERFVALSDAGACRAYEARQGVIVWTLAASLRRARERFRDASVGSGETLGAAPTPTSGSSRHPEPLRGLAKLPAEHEPLAVAA